MTDPVSNAVNTITRTMETGFLNPVTNGEIKQVVATISSLPAAQANQVIDRLQHGGELGRIAGEVEDGSILGLGGLSADERGRFFADMAGKLDGQHLATLSNAFAGTDTRGDFAAVTQLGDAVATHASAQAKIDYIHALAGATGDTAARLDTGFGYSQTSFSDAEGAAVGQVLGSLRGAQAEAGFRALGSHLPDVLTSAVDAQMTTTATSAGAANTMTWHATQFEGIMQAAASMSDADLKAQVFDSGVQAMRAVRDTNSIIGGLTVVGKDAALHGMTDGLTRIIDSDTSGVMRELTYNRATADGSSFSAYAKEMLHEGREAELGRQMGRLQVGNGGTENPVTRLDQTVTVANTRQERRPNAGALGYFVGSVYAGAQSLSGDVAQQRAQVTAILKSALTIVDKAKIGGPAAAAIGTGASLAKEWVQFAVNAAISDPTANAGTRLENAALPVDTRTGELGVGDAVSSTFDDTLASVQRRARP